MKVPRPGFAGFVLQLRAELVKVDLVVLKFCMAYHTFPGAPSHFAGVAATSYLVIPESGRLHIAKLGVFQVHARVVRIGYVEFLHIGLPLIGIFLHFLVEERGAMLLSLLLVFECEPTRLTEVLAILRLSLRSLLGTLIIMGIFGSDLGLGIVFCHGSLCLGNFGAIFMFFFLAALTVVQGSSSSHLWLMFVLLA